MGGPETFNRGESDGAHILGELVAAVHEGSAEGWKFADSKIGEAARHSEVMLWARGALTSDN